MRHYIDIACRKTPEIDSHAVLAALYQRIHLTLARLESSDIAVVFPGYSLRPQSLGECLRLISKPEALQSFMDSKWLNGLVDYVSISPIRPAPPNAEERCLRRVQPKSSPTRLRRRLIRRHGLSVDEAASRIPESVAEFVDLPFVRMTSTSTGQRFRVYLKLSAPQPARVEGKFSSYGLSSTSTVPWF